MGFMQYYKTAKNIPNPHSKIEYFIHITNFKKYPQKKKKKAMIFGLYLLGNGVLGNFVIVVKNVEPNKRRHCSSCEERRQSHPQNVTHFLFLSLGFDLIVYKM